MMPMRHWNHYGEGKAKAPSVRLILKVETNKALGQCYQGQLPKWQEDLLESSPHSTATEQHQELRWGTETINLHAVTEQGRQTFPPNETLTSLTRGASEPRCTLTDAIIRGAWSPVFAVAGQRAVGAPAALRTHAVTVDTWNNAHGQGWVRGSGGWHLWDTKSQMRRRKRKRKATVSSRVIQEREGIRFTYRHQYIIICWVIMYRIIVTLKIPGHFLPSHKRARIKHLCYTDFSFLYIHNLMSS